MPHPLQCGKGDGDGDGDGDGGGDGDGNGDGDGDGDSVISVLQYSFMPQMCWLLYRFVSFK